MAQPGSGNQPDQRKSAETFGISAAAAATHQRNGESGVSNHHHQRIVASSGVSEKMAAA